MVLEKGAVVDRGTHDELMQRGGRYRELCERQFILNEMGRSAEDPEALYDLAAGTPPSRR